MLPSLHRVRQISRHGVALCFRTGSWQRRIGPLIRTHRPPPPSAAWSSPPPPPPPSPRCNVRRRGPCARTRTRRGPLPPSTPRLSAAQGRAPRRSRSRLQGGGSDCSQPLCRLLPHPPARSLPTRHERGEAVRGLGRRGEATGSSSYTTASLGGVLVHRSVRDLCQATMAVPSWSSLLSW